MVGPNNLGDDTLPDVFDVLSARTLRERARTLFPAIAHGDASHRAWLRQAIEDHFAGRVVARPNS